jgi:hypothetical protein
MDDPEVGPRRRQMSRRRRRRILLGALVGAGAVVMALFFLSTPLGWQVTGSVLVGPRLNSFETVDLFGNAAWQNYSYKGVQFTFHLWCQVSPGGGTLCGNATEANGARYGFSFSDGPPSVDPQWQTWVAPDGGAAVQYLQGGTAHLLVPI